MVHRSGALRVSSPPPSPTNHLPIYLFIYSSFPVLDTRAHGSLSRRLNSPESRAYVRHDLSFARSSLATPNTTEKRGETKGTNKPEHLSEIFPGTRIIPRAFTREDDGITKTYDDTFRRALLIPPGLVSEHPPSHPLPFGMSPSRSAVRTWSHALVLRTGATH